jgi:hypothetical protein
MADYGFNLNLGPQTKPTSIADMLNIAGSAQALQQAQQLNPLQVQQAQQLLRQSELTTQKAEALNPEEIATGVLTAQEERKRQPVKTQKEAVEYYTKNSDRIMQLITGYLRDPTLLNAGKNPQAAGQVLVQMDQLLDNSGVDKSIAKAFMGQLNSTLATDPSKLPEIIRNIGAAATSSETQATSRRPQLTTTAGGAPALFTAEPGTITQPNIQGQQGQQQQTQLGEPTTQPTEQTTGGQTYPKRVAGDLRPYAPGEAEDEKLGIAYKNGLIKRQGELTTSKRNLDEVIKEATKLNPDSVWSSGFLGMVNRKFKDFVGDPTYKQLSKDLANVQIANIQAMGGSLDTVAGQQLTKMANGDETFPPSVLINIARRSYADLTDLDMRATAADKYAQVHGIANMNGFKQKWSANSDSKLFEAMAIEKSNLSPEQKKKEFKALLGGDPNVLKDLQQKKKNLEKLMATGDL